MARQVFWETWLVRLPGGGGFCRCLRRGREKVCYHLRWGKIFRKLGLYACPAGVGFADAFGGGVKKFAITSGGARFLENLVCTPARRGPTFVRTKVGKIRLGRCPKTPVAGCAGYELIFDGSQKSIRTAHRIAPRVACGSICPFPPPPFPWAGKGPGWAGKCRAAVRRSGYVRACKNRKPLTYGYG